MITVLKNAIVVSDGTMKNIDVVIEDDHIVESEKLSKILEQPHASETVEVKDVKGCFILPGVIDDHVHFRQPGLTQKADISSESRAAAAGGVTTYFDMPNTVPQTTTPEALEEKFAIAASDSVVNYSFFYGATNDNINTFDTLDYFCR